MAMSIVELEKALRGLRLSGMVATLEARALQVAEHQCDFLEALSNLVQDELDRRKTRLIERRFTLSGLPERMDFQNFDWSFNPQLPKREILDLATLRFVDAHEDALLIGYERELVMERKRHMFLIRLTTMPRDLLIIVRSFHIESRHVRSSGSLFHRGGLPGLAVASICSRAFRFVSRLARA